MDSSAAALALMIMMCAGSPDTCKPKKITFDKPLKISELSNYRTQLNDINGRLKIEIDPCRIMTLKQEKRVIMSELRDFYLFKY